MAALNNAAGGCRALVVGAALATSSCAACAGDGREPTGPGGGAAGAGAGTTTVTTTSTTTTSSSSSTTSGGEGGCGAGPLPEGVPDGWLPYVDWSCDCPFYVPGSTEVLPPPIVWEPCPDMGDGVGCRAMAVDWTDAYSAVASGKLFMDLKPDGSAVLAFSRTGDLGYLVRMVADADGPVRSAMIWHWQGESSPKCYLVPQDMNQGMVVYRAQGEFAHGLETLDQGALGGAIDELQHDLLAKYLNENVSWVDTWHAGSGWVAQCCSPPASLWAHRWDMSESHEAHSPALDPEGMIASQVQVFGDALFFTTFGVALSGINVWDQEHGFRPFIRWPGDTTRGAGNLGTDGVDMVWSYGEGKQPSDLDYPVRSVMTAPFTTDPAAVQPRRLRSEIPFALAIDGWQVGCGYAAHEWAASSLLVVRLSDGWSWQVPGVSGRQFGRAIGVTCQEVFALAYLEDHNNIARVRIDSLGPGMPPD